MTIIKLRSKPPAAKLPKLEVSPFKFLTWTEERTPEPTCSTCGCGINGHHVNQAGINGLTFSCRACDGCQERYSGEFTHHETMTVQRRGQFWSDGPYPHSVWVLPMDHAPWEDTASQPRPVALHVIAPGRYTCDWSEYKRERRELNRIAKREAA